MKGIILAGGTGSRLRPVTYLLNKNLLPIYNKPAIFYSIELLRDANITDICILAEEIYISDFHKILDDGSDFGVNITYISDSPNVKGPAAAIRHAKDFIGEDNTLITFADGIYDTSIKDIAKKFKKGATVFVKEVSDPKRFGIVEPVGPEVNLQGLIKIKSVEEKPANPKSNLAITGLGIFDTNLFKYLEETTPNADGEYYMTQTYHRYIDQKQLNAVVLEGYWQDMGTFDGLYNASKYWYEKAQQAKII